MLPYLPSSSKREVGGAGEKKKPKNYLPKKKLLEWKLRQGEKEKKLKSKNTCRQPIDSVLLYQQRLARKQIERSLKTKTKTKTIDEDIPVEYCPDTGILDAFAFHTSLDSHIGEKGFGLMTIDVDFLTIINNLKGEAFGDEVVKIMGQVMRQYAQKFSQKFSNASAEVFREGGDEFRLIFSGVVDSSYKAVERSLNAMMKEIKQRVLLYFTEHCNDSGLGYEKEFAIALQVLKNIEGIGENLIGNMSSSLVWVSKDALSEDKDSSIIKEKILHMANSLMENAKGDKTQSTRTVSSGGFKGENNIFLSTNWSFLEDNEKKELFKYLLEYKKSAQEKIDRLCEENEDKKGINKMYGTYYANAYEKKVKIDKKSTLSKSNTGEQNSKEINTHSAYKEIVLEPYAIKTLNAVLGHSFVDAFFQHLSAALHAIDGVVAIQKKWGRFIICIDPRTEKSADLEKEIQKVYRSCYNTLIGEVDNCLFSVRLLENALHGYFEENTSRQKKEESLGGANTSLYKR